MEIVEIEDNNIDNNEEILIDHTNNDNLIGGNKKNKKNKQIFIGEGQYGCTITPGLDCKGNINNSKYRVNKIQEKNRYSINELVISKFIRKIKEFKLRFIPIQEHCLVKFNNIEKSNYIINKCNKLFDSESINNSSNFIKKDYFMFYMDYIKGTTLYNYLYYKQKKMLIM